MGLLDDAIRDHLELKRLRGADPGEVAREQKEALEPALDGEDALREQDLPVAPEDVGTPVSSESAPVAAPHLGAAHEAPQPADEPDLEAGSQETAELDMQSVLDRREEELPEHALSPGPALGDSSDGELWPEGDDEDSLEWEGPDDASA